MRLTMWTQMLQRQIYSLFVLLGVTAILGCGAGGETANSLESENTSKEEKNPEATEIKNSANSKANDLVSEFGQLDCNNLPIPKDGTPDILGIFPGMSADEAIRAIRCYAQDGVHIRTKDSFFGERSLRQLDLSNQMINARIGEWEKCSLNDSFSSHTERQRCLAYGGLWKRVEEDLNIVSPGFSGEEQVVIVTRQKNFSEDDRPLADSVVNGLVEKYGEPQSDTREPQAAIRPSTRSIGDFVLGWVVLAEGEGGPKAKGKCLYNNRNLGFRMDLNELSKCKYSVVAEIDLNNSNESLVDAVQTRVWAGVSLVTALTEMKTAAAEAEAVKRAAEVERAKDADRVEF